MATSIYHINKGINRPIEFKGLKAQYISYMAVGLVILLLLFATLYLAGVALTGCLLLVFGFGAVFFSGIYYLNRTYGQYGLLKKLASLSLPVCIRNTSRKQFLHLDRKEKSHGTAP